MDRFIERHSEVIWGTLSVSFAENLRKKRPERDRWGIDVFLVASEGDALFLEGLLDLLLVENVGQRHVAALEKGTEDQTETMTKTGPEV